MHLWLQNGFPWINHGGAALTGHKWAGSGVKLKLSQRQTQATRKIKIFSISLTNSWRIQLLAIYDIYYLQHLSFYLLVFIMYNNICVDHSPQLYLSYVWLCMDICLASSRLLLLFTLSNFSFLDCLLPAQQHNGPCTVLCHVFQVSVIFCNSKCVFNCRIFRGPINTRARATAAYCPTCSLLQHVCRVLHQNLYIYNLYLYHQYLPC